MRTQLGGHAMTRENLGTLALLLVIAAVTLLTISALPA